MVLVMLWSFGAVSQSNPVGDSYEAAPGCYVVTSDVLWELGAVWFNESIDLSDPIDISLTMTFGDNDAGADGMVFVFQQVGINALGFDGGGMGFEGFAPSFGVELDTWQNIDFGDPFEDHMAMFKNGSANHNAGSTLSPVVQASATSPNIEDGGVHTFQFIWDPVEMKAEVYFDCELRLSETIDLQGEIFTGSSEVWWGFTGATGGASNEQTVCISEFALGLEPEYQMCLGDDLELGVVGGSVGTYSWEPALEVIDPTAPVVIVSPDESMNFTVTYTDICGEETSLETWVEVVEVELSLEEEMWACVSETITIEATGNADEYDWSTNESGTTIDVQNEGVFTVTGITGECEVTESIDIGFWPLPEIVGWEETHTACEGTLIAIDASSANADVYSWSNGDSEAFVEILDGQILEVGLVSVEGCFNSYSTAITFSPYPEANLPELVEGCENSPEQITAAIADTWTWEMGADTQSISVSESGTYVLVLESNGCETADSTEVILYPTPVIDWIESLWICEDSTLYLELPAEPFEYYWLGDAVEDSVAVFGEAIWSLTVLDTLTGCQSGTTLETMLLFSPEVDLQPFAAICEDSFVEVDVIASDSLDFTWSHGEQGPTVELTLAGDYYVVGENVCGTDTAHIEVFDAFCDCPTYVPNAFSPDQDGRNEVFVPIVECAVLQYRFAIYNRWGHVVFESFNPGEGWNGSGPAGTHFVVSDVYIWQLTYEVELLDGWNQFNETGTVYILR